MPDPLAQAEQGIAPDVNYGDTKTPLKFADAGGDEIGGGAIDDGGYRNFSNNGTEVDATGSQVTDSGRLHSIPEELSIQMILNLWMQNLTMKIYQVPLGLSLN